VSNMGQILFSLTGNFFQISGLKKTSGRFKKTFSELSFESKNEIDFIDEYYGSDLGNCLILQRKGPRRGGFLGLRRAFWGLKTPFLGDRDAKG